MGGWLETDNRAISVQSNLTGTATGTELGNKVEKSILDFFLFCDKMKPFVSSMIIDESKLYALSSYSKVRGEIHSDHNTMVVNFNLEFSKKRQPRNEYFNFKNKECQERFFCDTNNTKEFSTCFESSENVKKQGKDWFKKLHNFFHKSFKKLRFNGKIKETEMNKLFELRRKMVQDIKKCNDDSKNRLMEKLSDVESKITEKVLEENLLKIKKNCECLSNPDDLVNVNGM